MSNNQIRRRNDRNHLVPSTDSKCKHIIKTKPNNHWQDSSKKSSVQDLAAQGFHIGRELGEGSYCKVKSATYEDTKIAVKIITRDDISIEFNSKFLPREIDVLCRLDHKNIIKVYKIFSYPQRVYIFMELVERGTLLGLIKNCGRFMESEACYYFEQIVDAVRYLHSINVAHRDLKCENIMVDGKDRIKIIDFGFCRSVVDQYGRRVLSRTFCGSTAYASPEVIQGHPYNPTMYDVWSLGCVLFIMVTGTMPFDDSNVRKMVDSQQKKSLRYPSTFTVNREVKQIISKMLEPDVIRRVRMNEVAKCEWIENNKKSNETRRLQKNNEHSGSSSMQQTNRSSAETGTQTDNFNFFFGF